MDLVTKIQILCRNKRMSLAKLENELGFSKGAMYKWNVNYPAINKVLKVAQYFNVSVDFLLSDIKEGAE